jgi:hypothetical protein
LLIYIKVLGADMLTVTNILDLHEVVQVTLADAMELDIQVANKLGRGRRVLAHQVVLLTLDKTDRDM